MLDRLGEKPATRESGEAQTDRRWPIGSRFRRSVARGLSGRLLVLTIVFVMIAEVLIFVPSVANFRNVWLQSHLDTAESASIVYLDTTDIMLSQAAQENLLMATQALSVSIREGTISRLMASKPYDGQVTEHIDLGVMRPVEALRSTLSTLFFGGDRTYSVAGPMKSRNAEIQLVQRDDYLRAALLTYSRNILLISLAISLITAGLVFLALYWLIVRPIIKLSSNMEAFSKHPENSALIFEPTGRRDEIGIAEERLAALQTDLQATLRQKQHLADLGLAVSKINHDLRNILASAQLFSDRLTHIADPKVQRLAPKLVRTIDRAVEYTRSVLAYGKAMESAPKLRLHKLKSIVVETGEILGADRHHRVEWINAVPEDLLVKADSEQLFRVVLNLCRNAIQAMEAEGGESSVSRLEIDACERDGVTEIRVKDTGPGVPEKTRENLFAAFHGSSKAGGTGLGLAIAAELVRAHGGTIELERTGEAGSVFLIRLPAPDSVNGGNGGNSGGNGA